MKAVCVLPALATLTLLIVFSFESPTFAAQPADRIIGPIQNGNLTRLDGNISPQALNAVDAGKVSGSLQLEHIKLIFRPSPAQRHQLDLLLAQQQDPSSANYHKWLTPEQYADRFGLSPTDIAKVGVWLRSEGFRITEISRGRNQIAFSGSATQVEDAFHTTIHYYILNGRWYFANATEPSIPAALADVVSGIASLHNFAPKPRVTSSITGNHFMQPGDFATIYNVTGLYNSGLDGTGQTIAVAGQTDLVTDSHGNFTDVVSFRQNTGLSNPPNLTLRYVSGDPGIQRGDIIEANLDVEWAGGIAKNAGIIFVIGNPITGGGAFDALVYAVDNDLSPVISISYGLCEPDLDTGTLNQMTSAAQQANLQGQTIVTPSGDTGAADCDSGAQATQGLAVDFPSSMPYVTAAGGSEFTGDAASNPPCSATPYWAAGQCLPQDPGATARSYIPEMVWNDTSTDGTLSAGGGGLSTIFAEPSWQVGLSAITNGKRGVPDLSFSASSDHDGYLICSQGSCACGFRDSCSGNFNVVGGTSASTPAFAAIVALINQKTGQSQGNVNPQLYSLAMGTPGLFHDIMMGSNIVPCVRGTPDCPTTPPYQYGYGAGPGYDLASGWGSLDATALASVWNGTTFDRLTVSKTGSGTVTSSDGHINCGGTCFFIYNSGTQVTLTATPASGWIFSSWTGCDSTQANTCTVTMNAPRSVQVTFVTILQSLVFRPASVLGSRIAIATLTLAMPAPLGGLPVSLSSGNRRVASVPASLIVSAGHTSVRVYARSYHVRARTPVAITASQGTASISANLMVDP